MTDNLQEISKKLIEEMRDSFARNDWDQMTRSYEKILELKTDRAIRLEATCLSVRALVAGNQRPAARKLLNSVANNPYKKPVHYEFLARAHLDLRQYTAAAEACQKAEQLRMTETNGPAPT